MSAVESDHRIDLECVETQTQPGRRFVEEIQVKSVSATKELVSEVRHGFLLISCVTPQIRAETNPDFVECESDQVV